MKIGRIVGVSLLLSSALAIAQAPPPSAAEQYRWQEGPKKIELGHDIQIDLPEHYIFLGMPDADRLMRKLGNFYNDNLQGLITSDEENPQWFVSVRYTEDGHIDDSEKIDADALLNSIKEGTEQANAERIKNGFAAAHVDSWTEPPRYQRDVHHLVWALTMKTAKGESLNYNTRVLGRRGVVSLNLVTAPARLETDRPQAAKMLAATAFKVGARYEDFDKKTDKVAEYGLMGLILGGAGIAAVKVAKVGLLAGLLKFLVAGWKLVAAFFVAMFAGIKRFFTGKPAPQKETKLPPPGSDGNNS